jgi:hypothetical protein
VEGQAEQALLAALGDQARDVEERRREHLAALDDPDPAALFDDEQPSRSVMRAGDVDRCVEPARDLREHDTRRLDTDGIPGHERCGEAGDRERDKGSTKERAKIVHRSIMVGSPTRRNPTFGSGRPVS